jgi:STE24 endopeptidase
MNEDKATRYHRRGRLAGILSTVWTAVILAALLLTGASHAMRDWASGMAGANPGLVVALYAFVLSLVVDAATLPFSLYRGFLLERRYGLSTETLRHWLKDHAKAGLIGVVVAVLGAVFVYFSLRNWPQVWWVIAGAGYALVAVVLVNLAPVILLPLFFTIKPLERETLHERLTRLAAKAGTRIVGVYEWTLSDRTKKANAALTGMGYTRRILVSDTLLAEYSDDEIEVIFAHELAHHVHRDLWTSVLVDVAVAFAALFAVHLALLRAVSVFGLRDIADTAGLPVLLLTAGAIGLCVRPLLNALSRAHERRADSYALEMTENPSAFIAAMKRLGQQNLAEESPSKLVQAFFYTHPPIRERLRAAQEFTWARRAATSSPGPVSVGHPDRPANESSNG